MTDVTIENSTFADNARAGLIVMAAGGVVRDSVFRENGETGLRWSRGDDGLVEDNEIVGNNADRYSTRHAAAGRRQCADHAGRAGRQARQLIEQRGAGYGEARRARAPPGTAVLYSELHPPI